MFFVKLTRKKYKSCKNLNWKISNYYISIPFIFKIEIKYFHRRFFTNDIVGKWNNFHHCFSTIFLSNRYSLFEIYQHRFYRKYLPAVITFHPRFTLKNRLLLFLLHDIWTKLDTALLIDRAMSGNVLRFVTNSTSSSLLLVEDRRIDSLGGWYRVRARTSCFGIVFRRTSVSTRWSDFFDSNFYTRNKTMTLKWQQTMEILLDK